RGRARRAEQLIELFDAEVRNADRLRVAELARPLHPRPGPGGPALGPVDDVQIDLIDTQPVQAALGLRGRIGSTPGIELGRDEELLARDAALAQRLPDARLVAVGLRRVD